MKRVVITGRGLLSPLGFGLEDNFTALQQGHHGISKMPGWDQYGGLGCLLGGPVGCELAAYPRKRVRTMGRVGRLALQATEAAAKEAGLSPELLSSGEVGLCYGSTHGSSEETENFCRTLFRDNGFSGISGSAYPKFMSHTCAANLAMSLKIRGPVLPVISACTSASQSIGTAFDMIRFGRQEVMLCGGAEELHVVHAGVFDLVFAASTAFNDAPDDSPRPFDARRDGLVVGEGAGTLVLESLEHAQRRGAAIYGELLGYATNCDGDHITAPSSDGMAAVMTKALKDAALNPDSVDYINAHATATEIGDIAESHAISQVFGNKPPVSSTKGHTGHTLGACGAIEALYCLEMMRRRTIIPTRNLEELDPRCAPLNYQRDVDEDASLRVVMNNNFAFGGINTSMLLGPGE